MKPETDKQYQWTFIIFSIGYIVLGALLIARPESSQRIISYLLGGVAAFIGILLVVTHFAKKDITRAFRGDIPVGVLLLMLGLYVMVRWDQVWRFLPVLLGFAIVFDSILKLQHSFDLKFSGFKYWWIGLAVALGTAVLGILLVLELFTGTTLMYYFGTVLIIDGALNLLTIMMVVRQMKKVKKQAEAPPALEEPEDAAPGPDAPQ